MSAMLRTPVRDDEQLRSERRSVGQSRRASTLAAAAHGDLLTALNEVPDLSTIETAVASVSDKTHLAELARELAKYKVEIIATEGTRTYLQDCEASGLKLTDLTSYTRYPENLNGRLKTLHPKVQAGILAVKGYHDEAMKSETVQEAKYIDLVIANLYPFSETVRKGCSFFECIENIDIGGPAMLRAAAKNHACVTVVCDPSDYAELISEMRKHGGKTSQAFRRRCAHKVFELTARYDRAIADWFSRADPYV